MGLYYLKTLSPQVLEWCKMKHNYEFIQGGGAPIRSWTKHVPFEEAAKNQVIQLSKLPFVKGIAVLPDVHMGIGCSVGTVAALKGAIIPSIVGVDIGCGMMALKTNLTANDLPENLHEIRCEIEKAVPHGRTNNGGAGDRGAWHDLPERTAGIWADHFNYSYERIIEKHPKAKAHNTANHLGTLGGGNHFVELCLDTEGSLWIMLHSGSRGLGNKIGYYFIERAQQECEKFYISLPHKDLAYLVDGTDLFADYVDAVSMAQRYAAMNRAIMMANVGEALRKFFPHIQGIQEAVNCHHNYVERENHFGENVIVTRKGAVRARKTDFGIIPGSMGAKSFIVRGLGNQESFCSCSHGAGRVMSRTEAKKIITLEDHIKATEGVECRKDADVIDESPKAYKSIDDVMKSQEDLVEIVATLKQVLCVKG